MNRPVARSATDGSTTLRRGRFYRLLLVVNGAPFVDELEAAMMKLGLEGHDLALSPSDDEWPSEKPSDWPDEQRPEIAVNEQLVRVSGSFSGGTIRVLADTPIAGGGTFTVWQAWDVGPARAEDPSTGAAGASPRAATEQGSPRTGLLVGLTLGAVAIGAYRYMSTSRRLEREEERFEKLEARAERARVGARVRHLMMEGYPEGDASAIATTEAIELEEQGRFLALQAAAEGLQGKDA